jgi:hypothetical protein
LGNVRTLPSGSLTWIEATAEALSAESIEDSIGRTRPLSHSTRIGTRAQGTGKSIWR